ncbi:sensor histidine kinase [Streptomyces calidiresistens]
MQVVAVLFLLDTAVMVVGMPYAEPLWVTLLGRLLVLTGCVTLAFRERGPVPVAVVVLLLTALYYPLGEQDGALMMVLYALALHHLAVAGRLIAAGVLAGVTLLAIAYAEAVTRAHGGGNVDDMAFLLIIGWFVGVIAFGHATRVRQDYLQEARRRALAAERERDARAQQVATAERLRIARELHDVLGHNISLIHVQTAAALHRGAKRPGETAELVRALESARDISREALRELRATLGVLRQVDEAAPTAPTAGLDRLPELVDRARATGLDVRLVTEGEPVALSPGVSLAAYRIVQESLTNVTRHSGADTARVTVTHTPDLLRLTIEDNGTGDPGETTGSGIAGMTERARALGGVLTARTTGTGFRVTAELPLT